MSDARSLTAWEIVRFTNLTIGASSMSWSIRVESSSSPNSVAASWAIVSTSPSRRWTRSISACTWLGGDTTVTTSAPVMARMSSAAKMFDGSAIVTTRRPSSS